MLLFIILIYIYNYVGKLKTNIMSKYFNKMPIFMINYKLSSYAKSKINIFMKYLYYIMKHRIKIELIINTI